MAAPEQQSRPNRQPNLPEPRLTLALTGDVMLGRLVNRALNAFGPYYPWGDTLPLLRQADLAVVNLECVIARDGQPWQRTPKVFHFRANPLAITALQVAGIDAVSLANNHVLDYEVAAFLEMLDRLDGAGIVYAGAGRNLAEAAQPAFLATNGIRVAMIAFTDNEPVWAATPETPGINYMPTTLDRRYFSRLQQAIAAARAVADVVFCSAHWGPNMRQRPTPAFRQFARAALEAGADLYVGHSAHVFQGVELYQGKPIIYDLGDFVDDYAVDPALRNDQSLLYLLTVSKKGLRSIEALPVLINRCQVNLAQGSDFEQIAARLRNLSAELGTAVAVSDGRLKVVAQRHAAAS